MKTQIYFHRGCVIALVLLIAMAGCNSSQTIHLLPETLTPTLTPTATHTSTPTLTLTPTLTSTPTLTPTPRFPVLSGTPLPRASLQVITPDNLSQMTLVGRWGKGAAMDLAFSPDGNWLAVATGRGVYLHDANTFEEVRLLETDSATRCVTVSPASTLVVAGGRNKVWMWSARNGNVFRVLDEIEGYVSVLSFSPDGSILAVAYADNSRIELWSIPYNRLLRTLYSGDWGTANVFFTPDGDRLISKGGDFSTIIWQVSDGTLLDEFYTYPYNIGLSPDGTLIAAPERFKLQLLTVADQEVVAEFEDPCEERNIVFSPDGRLLAVGGEAGLCIWRVDTGELIQRLGGDHPRFSPDGNLLAAISPDGNVRIWRVQGWVEIHTIEQTLNIGDIAFSPTGDMLVSAHGDYFQPDGYGILWRVSDGTILHKLDQQDWVRSVSFSQDERLIAASDVWEVKIWQTATGALIARYPGLNWGWCAALSPDSEHLAAVTGSSRERVTVWRTSDQEVSRTLIVGNFITDMVWIDDTRLAIGSWNTAVRLWQVSDGATVGWIEQGAPVESLALSQDGTILAVGDERGRVKLWSVSPKIRLIREMATTHRYYTGPGSCPGCTAIRDLAISPDNQLVVGLQPFLGGPIVWDANTGEILLELEDVGAGGVAFSPDGTLLAFSTYYGVIEIYGVRR